MRTAARLFSMVLLAGTVAACDDDITEPDDPADDIVTMRLTFGAQVVNITDGVVSGSATVAVGSTPVTAVFLDDDGATVSLPAEFELQVEPASGSGLTFTRTSAFTGTLQATTTGTKTVQVSLFHTEENHKDLGDFGVTVIVQ